MLNGLEAGQHVLTLRVDNRLYVDVGINAHSVSDHTQSNWNGIVGSIKLSAKPTYYIQSMQIYPETKTKCAQVKIKWAGGNHETETPELFLQAETLSGQSVGTPVRLQLEAGQTSGEATATVELGKQAQLWSEHTPNVYRMVASLRSSGGVDKVSANFGLREFKANGTRFEVNG